MGRPRLRSDASRRGNSAVLATKPMDLVTINEMLCGSFYEQKTSLGLGASGKPNFGPGQLVWAHIVYPAVRPQVLELVSLNRTDGAKSTFRIANNTAGADPNFPVAELGLEDDERFYIVKGKRRQAVVLQVTETRFGAATTPERYVWVVPRFGFKVRHGVEFQVNLAAFNIRSMMFAPSHNDGFSQAAALRFELSQAVPAAGVEPMFGTNLRQKFLSPCAWTLLLHHLHRYFHGKVLDAGIEGTITAYRELVMEEYRKYLSAK